ncbi:hypothetical protein EC396_07080 [Lutibacter sp. HS1-25]|uniref:DUF6048 family protein n=1 Tax=Lutibacter sp. HS1-25 TaxID=2485000 RepID=UPI001012A94E|nr:DUF6048 family protein [Lutibacter sp. HS1-25]RXP57065.1 hypothetical protein EC396_07080 [Lutibacter sp. HS1-25]
MIQLRKLTFIISILFTFGTVNAQQEKDTTHVEQVYGIRFGADISVPIISFIKEGYSGYEIVADARVYKNIYAAVEFGHNDATTVEDFMNFTTKGDYFKIGANYNAYENWEGMTNEIYVGFRYGFSKFSQTLNSYTPNVYGTYLTPEIIEVNELHPDLNAHWLEFILGIRAETFKNFYMGFSVGFKAMLSTKEPENFQNLYVPGFYKVSLNNLGFGFNYTLTYLIPYARK